MIVQVNAGDVQSSNAIRHKVHDAVEGALDYVKDHVTRVEVHLRDDNSAKHGAHDKRVTMEARIAGQPPLAIDHSGDDLYDTIAGAAEKLGRAVTNKIERLNHH